MKLRSSSAIAVATAAFLAQETTAAITSFSLNKTYNPNDFLSDFEWYTKPDPTHGLINYLSQSAAMKANLTEVRDGSLFLRVDTTPTALEGRGSVRITSKDQWSDGVYVLNVSHVPYGCSVWPAFWTVTVDYDTGAWPAGGEIDIVENANDQFPGNLASLHTNPGCTIPSKISSQLSSSTVQYTDCSGKTAENTGCRVMMGSNPPTWGAPLNRNKGGMFALVRDLSPGGSGISVWYWEPDAVPSDLRASSKAVDVSGWGTPAVHFDVADTCASYFGPHNIVINTALAGDWAAATWNESGNCAATYGAITDQVAFNGSSYSTAYWQIDSLRMFTSSLSPPASSGTGSSSNSNTAGTSGNGNGNSNTNTNSNGNTGGNTGNSAAWYAARVGVASTAILVLTASIVVLL
ncbi:hypothetical protein CF327_g2151 [Tilletia walkeri]|uniref:GH16 domain-containing protein n=1 Tax=Tilletia walkeri TaxID=117179 RepID=A0A8X7NFG8_9BASI|nr:hypothetical protein CF327_g2151 [Tilletia walkeri]KAE8271952.1 hypothetical protein A4X09_0g404 [Tilletia walkeri]